MRLKGRRKERVAKGPDSKFSPGGPQFIVTPLPGAVANDAENHKMTKYSSLSAQYDFRPIAVETLGAPGDEA